MTSIIYPNLDGNGIAVVYPTGDLPVEEVARKDVPAGTPYLFIEEAELPSMDFRNAWEADFSNPDGYGIGHQAWFAERGVTV